MKYTDFIQTKIQTVQPVGFDAPLPINPQLFDWQARVVAWALKTGRAALFENCGLGKTAQQIEWARQVHAHTGKTVMIMAPLAVAAQTVREGSKFGVVITHVREADQIAKPGIYVTNYDRVAKFADLVPDWGGVVLDESSILKSFEGKTRRLLTDLFRETPYKLACTATPSPNDFTELGQHADFLNICSPGQMLATWFINDTFDTGTWRLKKHAERDFWKWVASWAACVDVPSDAGGDDKQFTLPPLTVEQALVESDSPPPRDGELLWVPCSLSATDVRSVKRLSLDTRVRMAAKMAAEHPGDVLIWCETNDESAALAGAVRNSVEVTGSDESEFKELAAQWFKGELCACVTGKFRTKFPTCQHQDTSRNITSETNPKRLNNPNCGSRKTEKSGRITCENTTLQKRTRNGQGKHASNGTDTTPPDGQFTPHPLKSERWSNSKSKAGSPQIQKNGNHSASRNMESDLMSSTPCFPPKEENAPSVGTETCQNLNISRSSIIATPQAESEDYCAWRATKESESCGTARSCCSGPLNTSKRVLISKSSIFGYGMNLQNCHRVIFVGVTYSFEDFYQAVRRSYRFGQTKPVHVSVISTRDDDAVFRALNRKIHQHASMQTQMRKAKVDFLHANPSLNMKETIHTETRKNWTLHHGDCVRVAETIAADSVGFSVFSPPFSDLFVYSNDVQDMGNCAGMDDFMVQFGFLIDQLMRITMPGRECAVHCCDLLSAKWKDGAIELKDFSGAIANAFRSRGWQFHSRITIWKSPVTEMQRTKAHGLLYKTLCKDSSSSRVGAPDYLLVFRKPGDNPVPITHTKTDLPLDLWQELASPVWMTVDQGNVLNGNGAKEQGDERHIAPLQLDVINRALHLWSAKGDLVFSPFTGIGSEGYCSVKMGRRFVGSELKESYFKQAIQNLELGEQESDSLFAA